MSARAFRPHGARLIDRSMRLVVLLLLFAAVAHAQSITTGAIAGVVIDAKTGEPLPGVAVTASSHERAGQQTAITEYDGSYKITELIPGSYDVMFVIDPATVVRDGVEV